jgi:DNA invertase Pin-like site-specific DNA recombinase
MPDNLIPAAQYLRMSTEHQQYSLENQSTAIEKYAETHSFEVVRTYSDAAKSGVVLKHRRGLRQLLEDVVKGDAGYQAILVHDVSRWGRFQDTDESAHYEFLCKSAGVPVHYCAETFANDGTLPNLIMKALKRTMAGEYSRELSVKVFAGQKRLTLRGFKQGGQAGYGLRRMLVSPSGVPKQELAFGEHKSIATDRVILVPGPPHEVQTVREIYRMLVSEKWLVVDITRQLDRRRVPYRGNSKWNLHAVYNILTNPKYCGCNVFGRTSSKLYTPKVKLPFSDWIVRAGCFEPIVDNALFAEAQRTLKERAAHKTNEELLSDLRALLASEGRLSSRLIRDSPNTMSLSTYRVRFGSLHRSYELAGYNPPNRFDRFEVRRRTLALRENLLARIAARCPNEVSIIRRRGTWHSRLRLSNGLTVSVLIARAGRTVRKNACWDVDPERHQGGLLTLLGRVDWRERSLFDFYILPSVDRRKRFRISRNDPWLERGKRLTDLSRFCEVLEQVYTARKAARAYLASSGHAAERS